MYEKFYGLSREPFDITPDPSFLVLTPRHTEALANLYYGIKEQKGFVLLTGEVGTGKTLLLRCLLALLRPTQTAFAYVFNTALSPLEFLKYIMGDFGLRAPPNKSDLLLELNCFLLSRYRQGLSTALVVDEGQLLDRDVLEEIRLLTNLETAEHKLLQIVLVGQPELEGKLDSHELRQLKQRVVLRCRLEPLTVSEIKTYIHCRLQQAGARAPDQIFPETTIASVHEYSNGIPRLVNTLCANALITGFARQVHNISPKIITEVASDFRLESIPQNTSSTRVNGHKKDLDATLRKFLRFAELVEQLEESTRGTGSLERRS